MYWGSMAQGFRKSDLEHRARRREVARLFDQFKRNNPEATYNDFQQFIQQVGGGFYTPASNDQLRQYAAEGQQFKQRRIENEQLADMLKRNELEGKFEEMLKANLSMYDDPSEAMKVTLDAMDAPEAYRARMTDAYAGRLGGMAKEAQMTEAENMVRVYGPMLAARGESNPDFSGLTGRRLSKGVLDNVQTLYGGQLDVRDRQTFENEKVAVRNLALNDTGNPYEYIKSIQFFGPNAEKYRTALVEYGNQTSMEKENSLKDKFDNWLDRQSVEKYRDIYAQYGMDEAKRRAIAEATAIGYDPQYASTRINASFDGYESNWEASKREKTSEFIYSENGTRIVRSMMQRGNTPEQIRAELQKQNIYMDETQFNSLLSRTTEEQRRTQDAVYAQSSAEVESKAKETFQAEEQTRDKALSGQVAFMLGENTGSRLNMANVGEQLAQKYSIDPEILTDLMPILDNTVRQAIERKPEITDGEVTQLLDQTLYQLANDPRYASNIMSNDQRQRRTLQVARMQSDTLKPMDVADYVAEGEEFYHKVVETTETTLSQLEGKPVDEWTDDDIADMAELQQLLKVDALGYYQQAQQRAANPAVWVADPYDLDDVSRNKFDAEAFRPVRRLNEYMSRIQARYQKMLQVAEWYSNNKDMATSSDPNKAYQAIERLIQVTGDTNLQEVYRRFQKDNDERMGLYKSEARNIDNDTITAMESLAYLPANSFQGVVDAEAKQQELVDGLAYLREMIGSYEQAKERAEQDVAGPNAAAIGRAQMSEYQQRIKMIERRLQTLFNELKG